MAPRPTCRSRSYCSSRLGMRPDLTGRGLGEEFVHAGLRFARETYSPPAFRLTVATFNQRAIRVYERAGFEIVERFGPQTPAGASARLAAILRSDAAFGAAQRVLDEALTVHPGHQRLLAESALLATARRDWAEAVRLWSLTIEAASDPASPRWLSSYSRALQAVGSYERAGGVIRWAIDRLMELTERYCVVYRTLVDGPPVAVEAQRTPQPGAE
jgi:hypothetical protein